MLINTEPCCYGFFNDATTETVDGVWDGSCHIPFRGHWLWLWGDPDALVTSIELGGAEQLLLDGITPRGLPFDAMRRTVSITRDQFLSFVSRNDGGKWPAAAARFNGWPVSPVLASSFGAPHLMLPTCEVGAAVRFRFSGNVLGIVLVGEQLASKRSPRRF